MAGRYARMAAERYGLKVIDADNFPNPFNQTFPNPFNVVRTQKGLAARIENAIRWQGIQYKLVA